MCHHSKKDWKHTAKIILKRGFPRDRSQKKNDLSASRRSNRPRKETEKGLYVKSLRSLKTTKQGKSNAPLSRTPSNETGLESDVCESGEVQLAGTANRRYGEWKTLRFLFYMKHEEGMIARYTLECPMAPPKARKTQDDLSLTWMHDTGTC